jgi:hypothetical protein
MYLNHILDVNNNAYFFKIRAVVEFNLCRSVATALRLAAACAHPLAVIQHLAGAQIKRTLE